MHELGILFGSNARVKLLRLFVFNPDNAYERSDICRRAKLSPDTTRRELTSLQRAGLIKRKRFYKEVPRRKKGSVETIKKPATGWAVDKTFVHYSALRQFLLETLDISNRNIAGRFKHTGTIKLTIAAGVFVGEWDQRLDLLIVGDRMHEQKLTTAIRTLEAEIGRELRYAVFTTEDFKYRLRVYDRLIRDILDYKHRVVIDKLGYFS